MFFVTTNWRWKKKHTKSFGIKFGWNFERFPYFISMLLKITETRFDSEPICYFWINILFQVCVPHVHVNTLNYLLKRHLLPSYHGISRIPVDISRCTSCIRFKLAVTMVRKCGQTWGFTFVMSTRKHVRKLQLQELYCSSFTLHVILEITWQSQDNQLIITSPFLSYLAVLKSLC